MQTLSEAAGEVPTCIVIDDNDNDAEQGPTPSSRTSSDQHKLPKVHRPLPTIIRKAEFVIDGDIWTDHLSHQKKNSLKHMPYAACGPSSQRKRDEVINDINFITGETSKRAWFTCIPLRFRPAKVPEDAKDCSTALLQDILFCLERTNDRRKLAEQTAKLAAARRPSSKHESPVTTQSVPPPAKMHEAHSQRLSTLKQSDTRGSSSVNAERVEQPEHSEQPDSRKRKHEDDDISASKKLDTGLRVPARIQTSEDAAIQRKKNEAGLAIMRLEAKVKSLARTGGSSEEHKESKAELTVLKLDFALKYGMNEYAMWRDQMAAISILWLRSAPDRKS
ncbi:unnamed protein product [Zymoseptoria tritici ST99CH_3D7]|uniref:Uncharacterized protein n=1 Tax=Zymoseptoria tritici (strain ST99CH_3D7) TaxID=1276538 RepID=A0A1X7S7H8_ZYMT9|nr:unnamed protein product [Zymoseptoria tritici ST99CH_3D7]